MSFKAKFRSCRWGEGLTLIQCLTVQALMLFFNLILSLLFWYIFQTNLGKPKHAALTSLQCPYKLRRPWSSFINTVYSNVTKVWPRQKWNLWPLYQLLLSHNTVIQSVNDLRQDPEVLAVTTKFNNICGLLPERPWQEWNDYSTTALHCFDFFSETYTWYCTTIRSSKLFFVTSCLVDKYAEKKC